MTIRAEDGRYVQNCNISAFISNLPTPPGVTETVDTTHFSTAEASGSTSQAANVAEAIEMGAKVFLVDEDVSAANFMARDGRMRALVMDESITPLLYRVNGMYRSLGISCVCVVGGVGDWLGRYHVRRARKRHLSSCTH
jgi:predicted ABC-class ATPase